MDTDTSSHRDFLAGPLSPDLSTPLLKAYFEKRPMLLRYFTARTRNADDAEEIVQDIYLKIAALNANTEVANSTAYLFMMGTNIWRNRIRGEARARVRDQEWQTGSTDILGGEMLVRQPSPEQQLETRQALAEAEAVLSELPVKTQDIFRLYRLEGLTQAAVGVKLGISKSSVEKHLVNAARHLMSRLRPPPGVG